MSLPVLVVSHPDPDYKSHWNEQLWVLVGGADNYDGATAFYLGPNRDISSDDLAGRQLGEVIQRALVAGLDLNQDELAEALADYRLARGTIA